MSKLLEIEKGISSMDSAEFHRLCSAYLNAKYGYHIAREHTALNKEESAKGTPDTFILLPNGNYIFVEITAQVTTTINKLKKDLVKCFDENKTGIAIKKIEKIILCFSGKLQPKDVNELQTICTNNNCGFLSITIDSLKTDLFNHHKNLVKNLLHIELDTNQILPITAFIQEHQRKTTSLENDFFGRENEITRLKDSLLNNNIILLEGEAGVGKTRLAIEVIRVALY